MPWSVGGVPGLPAAGLMLKGSKQRTWLAAIWTGSVGESLRATQKAAAESGTWHCHVQAQVHWQ